VVDALDFHHDFLAEKALDPLRDFYAAQIAEATLLVLNKCDLVSQAERDACLRALLSMNAIAEVAETAYGEIPADLLDRPVAWPKPVAVNEGEPPALAASLFRAHRPFHPQRFWDWFQAEHPGLLRTKGLVWLASRNLLVGGVSRTRRQNACGPAGIWWAALPREDWPQEDEKLAAMQETWREPYGDRRQELVLLGYQSELPAAIVGLNRCLLTAEEDAAGVAAWAGFRDPFPDWDLGGDQG
jgi:G3E family GTPase